MIKRNVQLLVYEYQAFAHVPKRTGVHARVDHEHAVWVAFSFCVVRCVQSISFRGSIVNLDDTRRTCNMTSYKITYTNRCITQSWTGVRQYGQIFMLAVQRSHAS